MADENTILLCRWFISILSAAAVAASAIFARRKLARHPLSYVALVIGLRRTVGHHNRRSFRSPAGNWLPEKHTLLLHIPWEHRRWVTWTWYLWDFSSRPKSWNKNWNENINTHLWFTGYIFFVCLFVCLFILLITRRVRPPNDGRNEANSW